MKNKKQTPEAPVNRKPTNPTEAGEKFINDMIKQAKSIIEYKHEELNRLPAEIQERIDEIEKEKIKLLADKVERPKKIQDSIAYHELNLKALEQIKEMQLKN